MSHRKYDLQRNLLHEWLAVHPLAGRCNRLLSGQRSLWPYRLLFQGMRRSVEGSGEVYCWGWNQYGQLGDGTTIDRPLPTKVVGLP